MEVCPRGKRFQLICETYNNISLTWMCLISQGSGNWLPIQSGERFNEPNEPYPTYRIGSFVCRSVTKFALTKNTWALFILRKVWSKWKMNKASNKRPLHLLCWSVDQTFCPVFSFINTIVTLSPLEDQANERNQTYVQQKFSLQANRTVWPTKRVTH